MQKDSKNFFLYQKRSGESKQSQTEEVSSQDPQSGTLETRNILFEIVCSSTTDRQVKLQIHLIIPDPRDLEGLVKI